MDFLYTIYSPTKKSINRLVPATSILFAFVLTAAYVTYQINAPYTDWSKPAQGILNIGGWYHALYMFVQMAVVFVGLGTFPKKKGLILAIGGYLLTTLAQLLIFGYV